MSSFAPAESGGPKVLSHAAAYESKIQEKDLKQAVIRGSKGAAAREPSSPTKNFVIAKKRHESWLKDRPAVWFGALALAVALLELSTAFRLVSAPDATTGVPSRLPRGPLSAARALGLGGAAPAPKKPMEPAARYATLLGHHGARAGAMSAALVLVVAASGDGPTRLRAALTVAVVELASAYAAPDALVRTMEARSETGAGAADPLRWLECALPIVWLVVACFEASSRARTDPWDPRSAHSRSRVSLSLSLSQWRELQQPKQAASPAGATAKAPTR